MVQFFKGSEDPRNAAWGQLATALGQGLGKGLSTYYANRSLESVLHDKSLEGAPASKRFQALHSALSPYGEVGQQVFQNQLASEQLAHQEKETKKQEVIQKKKGQAVGRYLNGEELTDEERGLLSPQEFTALYKAKNPKPAKDARGSIANTPEENKKIGEVLGRSKGMSSDELKQAFDEEGIVPDRYGQYIENRRRTEEQGTKAEQKRKEALRAETLPLRTELTKKAQIAEQSIRNKEGLLNLIEKGDINDPTYAALAESLPLNLGKRLLSNDTIEYKGGLVEEYGDLKNIFAGATRVKEIELLEAKIADIYLTDEQKKAVLRSRINAEKAHIIRAEAAAELEDRGDLGVLQFEKEVEKIAKPKLDALFNQIIDEQKAITQDAENRKQLPLDINDPDDKKIMMQILKEAGGDKGKAKELAKKKGYTVKGVR